ncbi:5'-3' exonuclease family protein isoform X5 [Tasmannia lanceolata]|uniref:5'-3' exonuclease family protein isoform X5 n=1 Tax=Tasmannia lanceolata TaxID=3420 RepID=UPI0040629B75
MNSSLAAEEDVTCTGDASTSVGGVPSEEEYDEDGNEEMVFPVIHGNVDPTVLAALPPSMQLDLLVQMRERLMAENRQKYQKVKKAPTKFSELQIQAYLKTVAFRREIDEVQKSASGRGIGGVQTSRIASEANREFIFSSSFTGDKQVLSAGVEKNGDVEHQTMEKESIPSDSVNGVSSTVRFPSVTGAAVDESRKEIGNDVETYIDERGRVRVSRLRGMGIRMTRDLQRNLDLMKELEQEKGRENINANKEPVCNDEVVGLPKCLPEDHLPLEASIGDERNREPAVLIGIMDKTSAQEFESHNIREQSIHGANSAIEISFLEDDNTHEGTNDDDDLFARLVAESLGSKFTLESSLLSDKHSCDFAPDCSREEDMFEEKGESSGRDIKDSQPSLVNGNVSDEDEVEWEDGACDVPQNTSPCPNEHKESVSRGSLEEEADFQEAIRRSLEDFTRKKSPLVSSENDNSKISGNMVVLEETRGSSFQVLAFEEDRVRSPKMPSEVSLPQSQASCEMVIELQKQNTGERDILQRNDSPEKLLTPSIMLEIENDGESTVISESRESFQLSSLGVLSHEVNEDRSACESYLDSNIGFLSHGISADISVSAETSLTDQITTLKPMEVQINGKEQYLDNSSEEKNINSFEELTHNSSKVSYPTRAMMSDLPNDAQASFRTNATTNNQGDPLTEETTDNNRAQVLNVGKHDGIVPDEGEHHGNKVTLQENLEVQMEPSKASLDEEMLLLKQERIHLGDEQRKLERNAESVSSEMFAECQELLQMFGLPYIIAPMEAEAQCAYMELINLVDGVVTDDSDVFLFGAQSVYKNIFDDRKYVETYFVKDIESELGLTREKLIRMALLLGSDYTEGVSGIGIVNAIEVVNAFPEEDGLQRFREWLESPDPAILGKLSAHTGENSRKRSSKVSIDNANSSTNNVEDSASNENVDNQQSGLNLSNITQIFMDKHRNVSKNWHIPSSFPSETVVSAYTSPQVDKSTEPFSWGKPDLFVLRKLCWERFGWSNQKADELLIPVLKEYNKHETQLRLEAFYTFNERFAKIRSQRIKKAVKGITGNQSSELIDLEQKGIKSREKRRISPSGAQRNKTQRSFDGLNDGGVGNEGEISEKAASKKRRKQRIESQVMPSEVKQLEPLGQKEGIQNVKKGAIRNVRGRGRGRGVGSRIRKEVPSFESTETSTSDGSDDGQVKKTENTSELRRSARPRNQVKYAANDLDADGLSSSSGQSDRKCVDDGAVEQDSFHEKRMASDADCLNDKNRGDEASQEDSLSRDYLNSGGGFCMEGSDLNSGPVQSISSPTRAFTAPLNRERIDAFEGTWASNDAEFSGNNGLMDINEPQKEILHEEHKDDPNISYREIIDETDLATEEPVVNTGLSAMPALRRKRRKTR